MQKERDGTQEETHTHTDTMGEREYLLIACCLKMVLSILNASRPSHMLFPSEIKAIGRRGTSQQ